MRKISANLLAAALAVNTMLCMPMASVSAANAYEFENGSISDTGENETKVVSLSDASGGKAVDLRDGGDAVTLTVDAENTGNHRLTIRYSQPYDEAGKYQNVIVNGADAGQIFCDYTGDGTFSTVSISANLKKGSNTVMVEGSWGWSILDSLTVEEALVSTSVSAKLSNPNASAQAQSLYSFLCDTYGNYTLSGQQESTWIDNEKTHYTVPPINAIVNAVRLKNSSIILASINENTIAMIPDQKSEDMTEHAFAQHLAQQVSDAYRGAVDIRTEHIIVTQRSLYPADIFRIDNIISSVCAEIRGKMISMQSGTFLYKESFHAVREAIYAEPQKEWTLDGITRSMGISRSHFQRLYKEMFGKSCKEDIITARLERAKWLLKNTSISVADVAEQCGYLNTSHFIRQFSAKLALSPTEYRKQVKKEGGAQ